MFKKKEIVHEGTLPHLADFLFLEAHILHRSLRSTSPHGNVQHNPKKIDCIKKKVITAFLQHLKIFGFDVNVEKWTTNALGVRISFYIKGITHKMNISGINICTFLVRFFLFANSIRNNVQTFLTFCKKKQHVRINKIDGSLKIKFRVFYFFKPLSNMVQYPIWVRSHLNSSGIRIISIDTGMNSDESIVHVRARNSHALRHYLSWR